jgi:hypothetical protein
MLELADEHRVAEVEIGCRGIESGFDTQGATGLERLLEAFLQICFANDFDSAFGDVGQLFIYGFEWRHDISIIAEAKGSGLERDDGNEKAPLVAALVKENPRALLLCLLYRRSRFEFDLIADLDVFA